MRPSAATMAMTFRMMCSLTLYAYDALLGALWTRAQPMFTTRKGSYLVVQYQAILVLEEQSVLRPEAQMPLL